VLCAVSLDSSAEMVFSVPPTISHRLRVAGTRTNVVSEAIAVSLMMIQHGRIDTPIAYLASILQYIYKLESMTKQIHSSCFPILFI
jgi:hypothetical protein